MRFETRVKLVLWPCSLDVAQLAMWMSARLGLKCSASILQAHRLPHLENRRYNRNYRYIIVEVSFVSEFPISLVEYIQSSSERTGLSIKVTGVLIQYYTYFDLQISKTAPVRKLDFSSPGIRGNPPAKSWTVTLYSVTSPVLTPAPCLAPYFMSVLALRSTLNEGGCVLCLELPSTEFSSSFILVAQCAMFRLLSNLVTVTSKSFI